MSVKKYKGSVIVTVLLFFYLFMQFFLLMVTDYRLTHSYTESTRDFYTARIMKMMFLSEIKKGESLGMEGSLTYSTVMVEFYRTDQEIEIQVIVSENRYTFHERLEK